jgi:NADPH:quinone reductase-like Zn-dependent oxidoreductase
VTSSSTAKIDRSIELGAAGGVLYTDDGWPVAAKRLTEVGRGFDVVLDCVGNWQAAIEALRPGGRLVVLSASRAQQATVDVRRFYFGQFDLLGTTMGSPRDFAALLEFLAAFGVPSLPVDREFPLGEAARAHALLEAGARFGKIVLRCDV